MSDSAKSFAWLFATIVGSLGAQIALVPSWSEATSPHFIGALAVTVGAVVAGWIIKSPVSAKP